MFMRTSEAYNNITHYLRHKPKKRDMMIRNHCYCFSGVITIFFSILFRTLASPTLHFCRHDQRDALLEFRDEFPKDKTFPSSWNRSSDCCFWEGVKCNDKSGQVLSLNIHDTFLNGSLKTNSSLFRLQYLRHLNLYNCNLQGRIPSSLGTLSRLTLVDLSSNNLVGEIPTSISNLNRLRYLSLWGNALIGVIPSSLGNLSHLERLELDSNHLVGEVPASIGNLYQLKVMSLSYNNLSGTNLLHLDLSNNMLEGQVPACVWSMWTVALSHNSFSSFENSSQETLIIELELNSNFSLTLLLLPHALRPLQAAVMYLRKQYNDERR
ncbi:unnamed protein product [Thlaspi arvense]|uniref:Leucine-rich repeat-containing N-terminal plant-type domain-containing protein n=1 Tax=Thlaspi arvense TaxID=13288 RepID=A0AAU9SIF7_THLAR|nr:unnamed protein product [Thlaspi arvense]